MAPKLAAFAVLEEVEGEISVKQDGGGLLEKQESGIFCSDAHAKTELVNRIVNNRNGRNQLYAKWKEINKNNDTNNNKQRLLHHGCGEPIRTFLRSDWSRQKGRKQQWCRVDLIPSGVFFGPRFNGRISGSCATCGTINLDLKEGWIELQNTRTSRASKLNNQKLLEEGANRVLENLGNSTRPPNQTAVATPVREKGTQLSLVRRTEPRQYLGCLRDLDQRFQWSLGLSSVFRKDRNYEAARSHLNWVGHTFDYCVQRGLVAKIPAPRMAEFVFQSAVLMLLPVMQTQGRNTALTSSSGDQSSLKDHLNLFEKKLEEGLKITEQEEDGMDGPGRWQFESARAIAKLAYVKHLRASQTLQEAYQAAVDGADAIQDARFSFGFPGDGVGNTRQQGRVTDAPYYSFALCRSEYLLLREAIRVMISQENVAKLHELTERAVQVCIAGLHHVEESYELWRRGARRSEMANPSDVCEMRRCLAEAFYVNKQYENASRECRDTHNWTMKVLKLEHNPSLRIRAIRVVAIRVASLSAQKEQQQDAVTSGTQKEVAAACELLLQSYQDSVALLAQNDDDVKRARVFMATGPCDSTVIEDVTDASFLPLPLLPKEFHPRAQEILQQIETLAKAAL